MDEGPITGSPSWIEDPRGHLMKTPDDLAEMLWLKECGWSLKRIADQILSTPTSIVASTNGSLVVRCSARRKQGRRAFCSDVCRFEEARKVRATELVRPRSEAQCHQPGPVR